MASRASATSPCVLDDAAVERTAHRRAPQCREPPARQCVARLAQSDLGGERDGARGTGQGPGEFEAVGDVEARRHLVGVLRTQHVAGAPGHAVQLRAHVQQQFTAIEHVARRTVDELRRGQRVDQLDVAETTVPALEVRLDAVRDVTGLAPPVVGAVGDLLVPAPDARPPRLPHRGLDLLRQLRVAREVSGLQEPERGAQVGRRDLDGLSGCAHGVVEPDPRVPQGVPQLFGQPVDVLAAVVQQHEIEVGVGRELAPPQRADGDQRGPVGEADGAAARGEPEVVQVDQGRPQRLGPEPPLARSRVEQHRLRADEVRR